MRNGEKLFVFKDNLAIIINGLAYIILGREQEEAINLAIQRHDGYDNKESNPNNYKDILEEYKHLIDSIVYQLTDKYSILIANEIEELCRVINYRMLEKFR